MHGRLSRKEVVENRYVVHQLLVPNGNGNEEQELRNNNSDSVGLFFFCVLKWTAYKPKETLRVARDRTARMGLTEVNLFLLFETMEVVFS